MKFSVAIPAYKPQFLKEAIESVQAQSFTDWELIIVDDCSPADLRSIVAPFLLDSRISYYRNEKNFGLSMWWTTGTAAWNTAQAIT